jgi:hypothetical protein
MAAGLGFKDFVTGEVLTAADVDGYLMQGIWVFASAAARDAAVTSPQEGNACYLKDTNEVLTYSGSAWVAVGGGGTTFAGASATNTSATLSVANITFTAITFAQENFDTNAYHSTSSNTSRMTIPAGKGGYYQVNGSVRWDANTTADRSLYIYKNGAEYVRSILTPSAQYPTQSVNAIISVVATDYLELFVYQASGGTRTAETSQDDGCIFSIGYLGA